MVVVYGDVEMKGQVLYQWWKIKINEGRKN